MKKKGLNLVLVGLILLGLAFVVVSVATYLLGKEDCSQDEHWVTMEQEGRWIDCQPPLSETEQEACDEARRRSYPYIAY